MSNIESISERIKEKQLAAILNIEKVKNSIVFAYIAVPDNKSVNKLTGQMIKLQKQTLDSFVILNVEAKKILNKDMLSFNDLMGDKIRVHGSTQEALHVKRVKATRKILPKTDLNALIKADIIVNNIGDLSVSGKKQVLVGLSDGNIIMPYQFDLKNRTLNKVNHSLPDIIMQSPNGDNFTAGDVAVWLDNDVPDWAANQIKLINIPNKNEFNQSIKKEEPEQHSRSIKR